MGNKVKAGIIGLSVILLLTIIFSACQTDIETAVYSPFQIPETTPLLVNMSLEYLPLIPAVDTGFFIINKNIQALISQNRPEIASDLLDNAVIFMEENFEGFRRIEAQIMLARSYIDAESVTKSIALLEDALERISNVEENRQGSILLQEIISVAIDISDEALDLLRTVIRRIYIIRDYGLRSSLLLDSAQKYQEEDEGANILLQQAIPAISSIQDSLFKAQAYSALALRFIDEGLDDVAETYFLKSLNLVEAFTFPRADEGQQAFYVETLANLARGGLADKAFSLSASIIIPRIRAEFLLEMVNVLYLRGDNAEEDNAEEDSVGSEDLVEELYSVLENANDAALFVSTLLSLSRVYLAADDGARAVPHIEAALSRLLRINDPALSDSFLLELSLQYTEIAAYEEAIGSAERIRAPLVLFRAYKEIVAIRLDAFATNGTAELSREIIAELSGILDRAIALGLEPAAEAEELYGMAAVQYIRLGDVNRALGIISQMSDARFKSLSLADAYASIPPTPENSGIVELYQDQLRNQN